VEIDDLLVVSESPPYRPPSRDHEPDLFHGAVTYGGRHGSRSELEVGHGAAGQAEQHPHVRPVRRDDIPSGRQDLRLEHAPILLANWGLNDPDPPRKPAG